MTIILFKIFIEFLFQATGVMQVGRTILGILKARWQAFMLAEINYIFKCLLGYWFQFYLSLESHI